MMGCVFFLLALIPESDEVIIKMYLSGSGINS